MNIISISNFHKSIIIILTILCFSCNTIKICIETDRKIKTSDKYVNQVALTVDELKELILGDTTHYKVVIFYTPCCGPCIEYMKTDYKEAFQSCDSTVKFFFILDDCGGLKYNEEFLQTSGITPDKMYYIKDTSKDFYYKTAENRKANILNYIFPLQSEINGRVGVPTTCIVSKDNRLKLRQSQQIIGNDTIITVNTFNLSNLKDYNFDRIDFDKIETKIITNDSICNPQNCKY